MKFKIFYVSFFLSLISFSQNNDEWNQLLESAHNIGYRLYNINQSFCDVHINEYNRLVKESAESEPEAHHFVMIEQWAKDRVINWVKRVTDWQDRSQLNVDNLLIFFRSTQDSVVEVPIATVETAASFFVVNLEDDLKFSVNKSYKKIALNCSIYHDKKPNILWNIFWREFMSGRHGLLKNKVEFTAFSNSRIRKKFRRFKRYFYRFKKQNIKL